MLGWFICCKIFISSKIKSSNLLDLSASRETILMATISSKMLRGNTCEGVVAAVHSCEIALPYEVTIVIDIVLYLLSRLGGHLLRGFAGKTNHLIWPPLWNLSEY